MTSKVVENKEGVVARLGDKIFNESIFDCVFDGNYVEFEETKECECPGECNDEIGEPGEPGEPELGEPGECGEGERICTIGCKGGDGCRNYHGKEECEFYKVSMCETECKGRNCTFAHLQSELRCRRGTRCPYVTISCGKYVNINLSKNVKPCGKKHPCETEENLLRRISKY